MSSIHRRFFGINYVSFSDDSTFARMKLPTLTFVTAAALAACATPHVPPSATSIDDLVKTHWKVPNYQFGQNGGITTTVPHDRLSFLKDRIADLSALCSYQRGIWEYLGPPSRPVAAPNSVRNSVPSVIAPALNAPATQQNLATTIQAGEQAVTSDVFAKTVTAMQNAPDQETRAAIDNAERLHWLGSYQCAAPTQSWGAEMRFRNPIRMSSQGIVYKRDVVIETMLTKKN